MKSTDNLTLEESSTPSGCCSRQTSPLSCLINILCCRRCKCCVHHQNEFQNEERLTRVIAIYDYDAVGSGEISMKKGDFLIVIHEKDADWCKATNVVSLKTGFIPRSYVALTAAIDSEEWYFGDTTRKEAEKLLEQSDLERGVFMIRKSEKKGMYALSVRDIDPEYDVAIKHYQIKPCDEEGYYISYDKTFTNLRELVTFYSGRESSGLCHRLIRACPKPKPHMWDLSPQTKDNWEVDRRLIRLTRKLGSGSFGEVWHALWQEKVDIAVKCMKAGSMTREQFLQEATIMKGLRHVNLVSLYAVCSDKEPIYIVTEYMPLGCLLDHLQSDEGKNLRLKALVHMATQISSGMKYLEQMQLVHRDLAARNILVGHNDEVKISDFGMARILEDKIYSSENSKVPVKWTAPEALETLKFTVKSDVWSFGILLMEIVTHGEQPYPAVRNFELHEYLSAGHRMSKPRKHNCPDVLYDIMLQCWAEDPEKRPTFEFIFNSLDEYLISAEVQYTPVD